MGILYFFEISHDNGNPLITTGLAGFNAKGVQCHNMSGFIIHSLADSAGFPVIRSIGAVNRRTGMCFLKFAAAIRAGAGMGAGTHWLGGSNMPGRFIIRMRKSQYIGSG